MRQHVYTIEWHARAGKSFRDISDQKLKDNILSILEQDIARNPFLGKPLTGPFQGVRSYRAGMLRILYKIYKHRLVIVVLDIGHRKDVYR